MEKRLYIYPEDLQFINMYFMIDRHDAEDVMTPAEALVNFQASEDKILSAYKLGLAIGKSGGSFGLSKNYTPNSSQH